MIDDRDAKVRQRAYEIWEKAGRPHGQHDDHWHQAMDEMGRKDTVAPAAAAPKPAAPPVASTANANKPMRSAAAATAPSPVMRRKK